jgi:hypothetical protein
LGRQTDHDKDAEILLLRQQLRILQRKQSHPPRIAWWEKLMLVVLARRLTELTSHARVRLSQVILLVKPDTLLKWHRELVRRKWTFKQQARQFSWKLEDRTVPARFLIHDRDTKFPAAFDTVFTSENVTIIRTPVRAPNANAFAERWIRSAREECLDKVLILGEGHLHRVLTTYLDYYNHVRPHQGIEQRCPVPLRSTTRDGPVERRDLLGGVLHDYERRAA